MPPEFNRIVVETLAKRAALMCSNIECRTVTSGPAETPDKSINIGEAAHIYGAKDGAARFRSEMTDGSRAEITNGIWLCRNCHKQIDSDPQRFPAELLFRWRAEHESYVISKLGTANDRARRDLEIRAIDEFAADSALVGRIVLDRLPGWEHRLTAELLRSYLKRATRGWNDLKGNLYTRSSAMLAEADAIEWLQARLDEAGRLVSSLAGLYSGALQKSWGDPGVPGDPHEIRHVCKLIQSAADQILAWEEAVRFVFVAERYRSLLACLPGSLGRNLEKLGRVPEVLDEAIDWLETHPGEPAEFEHTVRFDLPDGWVDQIEREMKKIAKMAGVW